MFFDGEHVLQSNLFSDLIKLLPTMRNAVLQRLHIMLQVVCSKPYGSQSIGAGQRGGEKSPFRPISDLGMCCAGHVPVPVLCLCIQQLRGF